MLWDAASFTGSSGPASIAGGCALEFARRDRKVPRRSNARRARCRTGARQHRTGTPRPLPKPVHSGLRASASALMSCALPPGCCGLGAGVRAEGQTANARNAPALERRRPTRGAHARRAWTHRDIPGRGYCPLARSRRRTQPPSAKPCAHPWATADRRTLPATACTLGARSGAAASLGSDLRRITADPKPSQSCSSVPNDALAVPQAER